MIPEEIKEIIAEIDGELIGKPYYNGGNLLSLSTLENYYNILISTTIRTTGKTSYYAMVNCLLHKKFGKNICYLVRQTNELKSYELVFEDIIEQYGYNLQLKSKSIITNVLSGIYSESGVFAYVANIRKAETLKKYSSIFRDTEIVLIEEYQPEKGKLASGEPELLKTMLRTIGRGRGEQVRDVIAVLLGNPVSILNPYLVYFNIAPKYRGKDGIIKCNRVAAEFSMDESVAKLVEESSIASNFRDISYDIGKNFMYSSDNFVTKKIPGKTKYIFTIIYDGMEIGIREESKEMKCYCVTKADPNCKTVMVVSAHDMEEDRIKMDRFCFTWKYIEERFNRGKLFYQTLELKEKMFDLLGISAYN